MTPQDKVISLELAKKIYKVAKKYGVELPESEQKWWFDGEGWGLTLLLPEVLKENGCKYFPAYTADELLEWLPVSFKLERQSHGYNSIKKTISILKDTNGSNTYYIAFYTTTWHYGSLPESIDGEGKTPADALCKLAIKLIEEGVIK